jgi:hypothetical protein
MLDVQEMEPVVQVAKQLVTSLRIDIDECSAGSSNCDANAMCQAALSACVTVVTQEMVQESPATVLIVIATEP